ncbi:MAG: preprotein translocase subunit SecA [Actinomycetota bacterium]|nr:preprotein translocase subunit SecA [Actinomycetota bacterium]
MLDRILRMGEGREAKRFHAVVAAVDALGADIESLTDGELRGRTDVLRARLADGATLEAIQAEAFAVVREAAWRVLHQRPFDVQVFGAAVLHAGNIAEMRTGEGKTLTSTMPVYLNALTGKGVHVVTVNEYLARRDAEWMGRVHEYLGLTVGVVVSGASHEEKQAAYACDITYGTNNEFGFDYLRDNMVMERSRQVQRGRNLALVDEVDSILVDEARTPLIISGPAEQSADLYKVFARKVVPNMSRGRDSAQPGEEDGDYLVDEAKRTVAVTEQGIAKVERILGIDNMFESVNTPLIHHLQNALKARDLYRRDREYVVTEGEVQIVDENTGRVLSGRRYSEGLHQAIEAKEGVTVRDENQTLATVTLQNYYRTYDKLAGMTGTAKTEESEFLEIYGLGVIEVPTNQPVVREDSADVIYKTEDAKFTAAVEEIAELHDREQPVLVGTTSVEKSERLSSMLTRRGVKHEVLNAKNHAREADIVAQAGRLGAVTVSTNMAGRGTDIILGGNAEQHAQREVAKLGPDADPEERARVAREATERFAAEFAAEGDRVRELGGLFVLGTERHESRRIDNQLRGRSGRQGDPGGSRFYLSLEDDLMRLFNASAVERVMSRLKIPDDVPIEAGMVTKAVANAQRQVESINFDRRKNVLKYDDVLNEQRKIVYNQRQRLLDGDEAFIAELGRRYLVDAATRLIDEHCPQEILPEDWDLEGLQRRLGAVHDGVVDVTTVDVETIDHAALVALVTDDLDASYVRREEQVGGPAVLREVERRVILSVIDRKWREHLYEMDALRDGIGLRAVGQRDPLTEYQREAYDSFAAMMSGVKEESVTYVMRLPIERADVPDATGVLKRARSDGAVGAAAAAVPLREDRRPMVESRTAPGPAPSRRDDGRTVRPVATGGGTYVADDRIGRNDPCHCGSGQKFKRCHGAA